MSETTGYRQRLEQVVTCSRELQSLKRRRNAFELKLKQLFSLVDIAQLTNELRQEPTLIRGLAANSCFHENGFWKLTVMDGGSARFRIRIHYWANGNLSNPVPENIHNHRFDCYSTILQGSLESRSWRISNRGSKFRHYHYHPQRSQKNYSLAYRGETFLEPTKDASHGSGELYFMKADDLHTAGASDQTVTVFLEQRSRLRSYADVFSTRYSASNVNLAGGALTPEEYLNVLTAITKVLV
jgi:hypothetical protein